MRHLKPTAAVGNDSQFHSDDLLSLQGELCGMSVRTTNENPRRVSVIDIIKAVNAGVNPYQVWANLKTEAVLQNLDNWQFPGERQRPTPVTDARGLVTIINLLPGARAARFRAAGADILVRYLGGDPTLISEIQAIRERQESAPADAPERVFGEVVEQRLRSGTGIRNYHDPQVYIGVPGGTFTDLRPVGNAPPPEVNLLILKTGMQLSRGRIHGHTATYNGFELLESCLTPACGKIEQEFKATMRVGCFGVNTVTSRRRMLSSCGSKTWTTTAPTSSPNGRTC